MTPKELINKLTTYTGPCLRLCCYCPEDYNTAEVKECVENMIREIYRLRAEKEELQTKYEELLKGNELH